MPPWARCRAAASVLLRLATDLTAGERTKFARGTAFDPRDVTLAVALDELRDAEQARVRSALRPLLVGSAVDARSPFRA